MYRKTKLNRVVADAEYGRDRRSRGFGRDEFPPSHP
jgi:hypothetical protein